MISFEYDHNKQGYYEWLETNGLGGYACGTLSGIRTRKYHGLFNIALKPPVERYHFLAELDTTIVKDGRYYPLSSHRYKNNVHPKGYVFLKKFFLDPWPVFEYHLDGNVIKKEICMCHEKNITIIRLEHIQGTPVQMLINPLVSCRDHDQLVINNEVIQKEPSLITKEKIHFQPYMNAPSFYLFHDAEGFHIKFRWYYDFWYLNEHSRQMPAREDLASFGHLKYSFDSGRVVYIAISTEEALPATPENLMRKERMLRKRRASSFRDYPDVVQRLLVAANAFIVRRNERDTSILAGFPWFTDWGRDAMISLQGLTISTGKNNIARSILKTFSGFLDKGMIPNHFPDNNNPPEYNTVDAALWWIVASYQYFNASKDTMFLKNVIFPSIKNILEYYENGTRYGIIMDKKDCLMKSGTEETQLTWMDAKIGDFAVTPRNGKPVEINALWYNGLMIASELAKKLCDRKSSLHYSKLAKEVRVNFNKKFWLAKKNYLADVLMKNNKKDTSIRPNQIFAISLPFRILQRTKEKHILEIVKKHLLVDTGLRTLSPEDKNYKGHYGGDAAARDTAYHQGTVWPWLLGPYITALINVYGKDKKVGEEIDAIFQKIDSEFFKGCIGQIAEIYEGDSPENEHGCFAQSWSVAELLRTALLFYSRQK